MKQWLISQIPLSVTPVPDLNTYGLIHRLLLLLDCLLGQVGSQLPFITISSRTALRCRAPQEAPMWALVLGVILEKINPGHLQGALNADLGRAINTQKAISGN